METACPYNYDCDLIKKYADNTDYRMKIVDVCGTPSHIGCIVYQFLSKHGLNLTRGNDKNNNL